ncbi:hypothetical protein [Devosia sp. RR2S18]|uniref:hypothetical protein n=1 Tax=Devosia rhizosphaerae TaxID=3049774 RepID=UPI00253FFA20|nr:hypothetical protein [Devosia sp. RR2S18]WIJ26270.1 hypothetical protein QOV41_05780 [Devosia sp. RR2S18]
MNAVGNPSGEVVLTSAERIHLQLHAEADALVAEALRTSRFDLLVDAEALLTTVLTAPDLPDPSPARTRLLAEMGALLCLRARHVDDADRAKRLLVRARTLLMSALAASSPASTQERAIIRANLALVHLRSHDVTGDGAEAMRARMYLETSRNMLSACGDAAAVAWIDAMEAELDGPGSR